MRTFDAVILKSKMEEFLTESRKSIDNKINKILSFMFSMKEDNDNIIYQSN